MLRRGVRTSPGSISGRSTDRPSAGPGRPDSGWSRRPDVRQFGADSRGRSYDDVRRPTWRQPGVQGSLQDGLREMFRRPVTIDRSGRDRSSGRSGDRTIRSSRAGSSDPRASRSDSRSRSVRREASQGRSGSPRRSGVRRDRSDDERRIERERRGR
jgi:hypothetical protein